MKNIHTAKCGTIVSYIFCVLLAWCYLDLLMCDKQKTPEPEQLQFPFTIPDTFWTFRSKRWYCLDQPLTHAFIIVQRRCVTKQEGQHPLTGQRATNFRLLANQWAERRLVTWYGSRHRRRPHCIRRVPSARRKGHSTPSLLGPCLLWPRSPISATAELLLYNETLPQTFLPLLSKFFKRRQI